MSPLLPWFFAARNFSEAEIQNLGVAALGNKNVGGFDVAVNDVFRVGGVESFRNLGGDMQEALQIRWADRQ